MIQHFDFQVFLLIGVPAIGVMAAIWYFIIAPLEKRNHERKLTLLQQRIKEHEAQVATVRRGPASTGIDAEEKL